MSAARNTNVFRYRRGVLPRVSRIALAATSAALLAGADKCSEWLALWCHQRLLEGDALVARQHRFADANEPVTIAHLGWYVGNFVAARFALFGGAAESLESFVKKGFDVVRLQTASVGAFHVYADTLNLAGVHGIVGKHALVEQTLKVVTVECCVEHGGKKCFDLGFFAMADGFDEQLAQRLALELELTEYVEDLSAECLPCQF